MTRGPTIRLILAPLLMGVLVACGAQAEPTATPTGVPSPSAPEAPATVPPEPSPAPTQTAVLVAAPEQPVTLDIVDFAHSDLTVGVGATVTWVNTGVAAHTAKSETPGLWDSGLLRSGDDFSFTFTEAGTFPYICSFHPSIMQATITATGEEPAGTTALAPTSADSPALAPTFTPTPPTDTPVPPAPILTPPTDTPVPPAPILTPPTDTPVPPAPTPSPPPPEETPAPQVQDAQAAIVDFAHQDVTISVGATITWVNVGSSEHTVTSDTPGLFGSDGLRSGDEFSSTFTEPGSFGYFCSFHGSSMSGTVTVVGEGGSTSGESSVGDSTGTSAGSIYGY